MENEFNTDDWNDNDKKETNISAYVIPLPPKNIINTKLVVLGI